MNKRIRTYEELLEEEQRLRSQLESYKLVIADDIKLLKQSLNPFKRAAAVGRKLFTRGKGNPLLSVGLGFGIDLLLRRTLLARSGKLLKTVVPYFVKNYASHIFSGDHKSKFSKTLRKWLKKLGRKAGEAGDEVASAVS